MESKSLNGVLTFAPTSRQELMQYAFDHHKIMVAVNAEKILHATDESRALINRNMGYPDGIGAVWALQKKGADNVVKIPGCELWLDVVQNYHQTKSFYLVGGKQDIIEDTVAKLKSEFKGINICEYRNGYIKTEAEELALIEDIKKQYNGFVLLRLLQVLGAYGFRGLFERELRILGLMVEDGRVVDRAFHILNRR